MSDPLHDRPAAAPQAFAEELRRRLERLRVQGLLRRLQAPAGIDLVSNDTLGLAEHKRLRARMRAALDREPAGAGASRLLRGQRAVFDALERRLAAFCGTEAALLFANGYAANTGLLQALLTKDDVALSDALNHASLIDGLRLSAARKVIYPHLDVNAAEQALRAARPGPGGRVFIVTESFFGMDGDLAPLEALCGLAERSHALVVVDEAHATGLYGPKLAGRIEELGLRGRVLASVHTGGKALGAAGAWVAGPAALREWLINRARPFVFSTAPQPVLAAALEGALDVLAAEPWRRDEAHRKAALLRAALREAGVPCGGTGPIVPVMVGDNDIAVALQRALQRVGYDVRAVRPPTVPPGTARLRVCVREPVDDGDLLRFATLLGEFWRGLGAAAHVSSTPRAAAG